MTADQRAVVRAAAAHYRGIMLDVVVNSDAPADRALAAALMATLRSAGLVVNKSGAPATAQTCAAVPGLQVVYSAERSGAANAIAEALGRAKVVAGSVTGCRVPGEGVLRFIVHAPSAGLRAP